MTISGVLQCGLLWWGARKLGVDLRIGLPVLGKGVRRMLAIAVPGAIAGGALQVSSLVTQTLSGSDEGARSVLYNSDRLYQLPLGLIGVAVGLALVPRLSRHFAENDHEGAARTMDDGIGLSMAFTLPAAVALLIMPFFIIDATVTRGAFTSADALRTAEVLRQFAWGVPAFVLAKVLTPPFFARQKSKRPMQFSLVSVVITVVVGAALWYWLPHRRRGRHDRPWHCDLLGAWVNVFLLAGALAREGAYTMGGRVWSRMVRLDHRQRPDGRLRRCLRLAVSAAVRAAVEKGSRRAGRDRGRRRALRHCRFRLAGGDAGRDQGRASAREGRCRVFRPAARADKSPPMSDRTTPVNYSGPQRVFSGVQPSGSLHLGNYLGALVKFVAMQDQIPASSALSTSTPSPCRRIRNCSPPRRARSPPPISRPASTRTKSIIFAQSSVLAHAELGWIFNCVARMGWVERMTQFKDKSSGKDAENISVGLFDYPVLQAADILAYKATHVPVGEDQKQHLELSRDIAGKFNRDFNAPGFFPLPEPMYQGPGARIMSLKDGTKKMSKSDPSDASRINLLDTADDIAKKIKRRPRRTASLFRPK